MMILTATFDKKNHIFRGLHTQLSVVAVLCIPLGSLYFLRHLLERSFFAGNEDWVAITFLVSSLIILLIRQRHGSTWQILDTSILRKSLAHYQSRKSFLLLRAINYSTLA